MRKILKMLVFSVALFPFAAKANLFTLTLSQGGNTTTQGFTSVTDIFDKYEQGQLDTILSGYNSSSPATGSLDFRGIQMSLDYQAGNKLVFKIPALDINETFSGASQKEAFNSFKTYLKSNQDDLLTKILKESVSKTPYDAVAGNPASLMAQMTNTTFSNPVSQMTEKTLVSGESGGFVLLSPSGGTHKIEGPDGVERTATTFNLPLGYTFKFNNNWALGVDMPLSYIDIDGSVTYAAQVGLNVQIPLYGNNWFLIASGRVGATASEDTLSGGILYMGAVTSRYTFNVSSTGLTVINMYGRVQDYTLNVKGYDIKYGLRNNVLKNGLEIRQKTGEKEAWTVFGYDTRFSGSDLYIDAYDEVGVKYSRYFEGGSFFSGFDISAGYTFGDHYKAYRADFSFLF